VRLSLQASPKDGRKAKEQSQKKDYNRQLVILVDTIPISLVVITAGQRNFFKRVSDCSEALKNVASIDPQLDTVPISTNISITKMKRI